MWRSGIEYKAIMLRDMMEAAKTMDRQQTLVKVEGRGKTESGM